MNAEAKKSGKSLVREMENLLHLLEEVLDKEPSDETFLKYDELLGEVLLLDEIAEGYDFEGDAAVEEEFKNVCARIVVLLERNKNHFEGFFKELDEWMEKNSS